METEKQRLDKVLGIAQDILQVQDLDMVLERILTEARKFTNSDAGSLYLREDDKLKFSYTQNDTFQKKLAPGKKIIYSTFTVPISRESISGYVAQTGEILNIPDAYEIPSAAPYSFGRQFDEASGYRTKSMLTFPIKTHAGEVIGVLQLINALDEKGEAVPFRREDEPLINYFANNAALAIERARTTRAIIMRMIKMAELRDPKETGGHVNRVAAYSVEIYEQWARNRGMDEETILHDRDILRMSSMLHDVGKIAIADAILKKPARLDPDERTVMEQHTVLGARLFLDRYSDFDEASLTVALDHHEKWDGTGYPGFIDVANGEPLPGKASDGGRAVRKKAEEIHPFGRVVAIADVYDALSSKRSYKEPWTEERVLETLKGDAGTHFDPEMMDAFFSSIDVIRSISERYPG
jgi:HD-GYP domain-containing protein (c-di-GMP phosphodiesterase class II)